MEYLTIIAFSLVLLVTMLCDAHLLYALSAGYALFFSYGLMKGYTARQLFKHSWDGAKNVGSLLFLFALIGLLTGTWRASGTIAYLVVQSASMLMPSLFILSSFVLCAAISMLTGTAFGTSATMGVICMTVGNVLGLDPAYLGGAILSGSYFGDRMSPMSSSAHLTAKITGTDIFMNIKNMFRSALFPLLLTCLFYLFLGSEHSGDAIPEHTFQLLQHSFVLSWPAVIPALLMIVLACAKVHAKYSMLVGIVSASMLCVFVQDMSLQALFTLYWYGFSSANAQLTVILGGGGLSSMLTVACIVAISSAYVGIFTLTEFFQGMHRYIARLAQSISPFGSTILVAFCTCMMTCNQTLSIFLTKSLCEKQYTHKEHVALAIENSAVLMAGLIPWNIACSVVLANVHAPMSSIFFAFFLYLTPLCSVFFFSKLRT